MKAGEKARVVDPLSPHYGATVEVDHGTESGALVARLEGGDLAIFFPADLSSPVPPYGMTSPQLGQYVTEYIEACRDRVLGVGEQQYSNGNEQQFENLNIDQLLTMMREELQDVAVYAAMGDILIQRYQAEFRRRGL